MDPARASRLVAGLLLVQALAGCLGAQPSTSADPVDDLALPEDLVAFEQIHPPDEIEAIVDDLGQLETVEVERIGTSLEGRAIQLATLGEGDTELWIVGRQHGDEPTGAEAILLAIQALADPDATLPEDAPAIVQTLREHRHELLERLTLHFVPVGNPDGAAAYQRGTATGEDPNRDHFAFLHPFSRALREAFWDRRPDACLDLHNMGTGPTDFDAYGPEGPMMEAEAHQRAIEDANQAIREVDAAGGNGGLFNENYRAPAPADEEPNPTAYHPGTHDMFCTTRGAPGWTPEGAIESGSNGATDDVFAWSTRLHLVTVAAHALHWAGAYDASEPDVWKASGVAEPATEHTYTLEEPGELTLQTVWRQTAGPGDHNLLPVRFTVTTPSGDTHEGRAPHPEAWTSTVHLADAEPGDYELSLTGLAHASYELRAYAVPDEQPLVEAERTDAGLALQAPASNAGPVAVHLSDVFDPANATPAIFDPAPDELATLNGTVGERTVAQWRLTLAPGEHLAVTQPDRLDARGPFHVTASQAGALQASVEDALNPAAN